MKDTKNSVPEHDSAPLPYPTLTEHSCKHVTHLENAHLLRREHGLLLVVVLRGWRYRPATLAAGTVPPLHARHGRRRRAVGADVTRRADTELLRTLQHRQVSSVLFTERLHEQVSMKPTLLATARLVTHLRHWTAVHHGRRRVGALTPLTSSAAVSASCRRRLRAKR